MLKFGRKPKTEDKRDLLFKNYLVKEQLPPLPPEFGHETLVTDWGMLGNDTVGDCTCAAADHETMLWTTEGSRPAQFTTENTISDYSAITGYKPDDPNSDRGAEIREVLKYRQNVGMVDANGVRHKIGPYLSLDVNNLEEIYYAIYLFSNCEIGFNVPAYAMDQFKAGEAWDVSPYGDPTIVGSHDVPLVADRNNLICVTWGKLQQMTKEFFLKYCEEAWVILSEEFLKGGVSPEGFNLVQLQADFAAIKGAVVPVLSAIILAGTIPTLEVGVPFDLSTLSVTGEDQNGNPYPLTGLTRAWEAIEVTGRAAVSGSMLMPVTPGGIMVRVSIDGIESNTLGANIVMAENNIIFQVGSTIMEAFGKQTAMDIVPILVDVGTGGRVMVPVRFDAEARGDRVDWNEDTKTVTITPTITPGEHEIIKAELDTARTELETTRQALRAAEERLAQVKQLADFHE